MALMVTIFQNQTGKIFLKKFMQLCMNQVLMIFRNLDNLKFIVEDNKVGFKLEVSNKIKIKEIKPHHRHV